MLRKLCGINLNPYSRVVKLFSKHRIVIFVW